MTPHYRQGKLVGRGLFQVRACMLLEGDFLVSKREVVRFVDVGRSCTWVQTLRGYYTWPNDKIVKVTHR